MNRLKRKPRPGKISFFHNRDGWQIIYTGFILIMLCFFIMFTSFASLEQKKIQSFVESFSSAVHVLDGGKQIEQGTVTKDSTMPVLSKKDHLSELFESVKQMSARVELDEVRIERTDQGIILSFSDELLFESGKADFVSVAYERMEKIGQLIRGLDVQVEIQGHTDNMPISTEQFPSNWELSTARAVTVLRYLTDPLGIEPSRLSAVGFGEYQPVAPNETADQRARNRRVDLVFKRI
jgi:chemotaxis protein MotB